MPQYNGPYMTDKKKREQPLSTGLLRIPLIFLIIGSVWILFHDVLLKKLFTDANVFAAASMYFNWLFVIGASLLLWILIRQESAQQKITDTRYQNLFEATPRALMVVSPDGKVLSVNQNGIESLGYTREELLGNYFHHLIAADQIEIFQQQIQQALELGALAFETVVNCKNGSQINMQVNSQRIQWAGQDSLLCIVRDMTEQKKIQNALVESEERFRQLVNQSPYSIFIVQNGLIAFANPASAQMLGIKTPQELSGIEMGQFAPTNYSQEINQYDTNHTAEKPQHMTFEETWLRKDGSSIPIQLIVSPFIYNGSPAVQLIALDLTPQKQAESDQILLTRQRDDLLQQLQFVLDRIPIGCVLMNADTQITLWNPAAEKIFGYAAQEIIGKTQYETIIPPEAHEQFSHAQERMIHGDTTAHIQSTNITKDGRIITCEWHYTPLFDKSNNSNGFLCMVQDITERRRSEDEAHLQLQRLEALREIGTAITASLDLDITLDILLNHTAHQLQADAAALLLYDPPTQSLRYARSRGLRPQSLDSVPLSLGKGYAGQVALTRQMMAVQLSEAEPSRGKTIYTGEGFQTYIGIPLIAKSQIKGVLEIYHRNVLELPEGWLDYLQIIAEQAAIAIENIQMFENLQRANLDLSLAYDTTIEGWSRALDLRDQGTGGHSRRLADISLRLARQMGISDAQLQHVYRGALLHDIGKVAVPDAILLKKGSLTDEEWVIMRKHPSYAFELLSPISYLRPALDIPYCHHERWDGSGYPRGLRGAEIPMAARIFTVIDVWDALLEDRSYRSAWPKEKVIAYLKEQAGTLFDPQVVETFLSGIAQEDA